MKFSLLPGPHLRGLPAVKKFVSAVKTPHVKRTADQKELLSTASKTDLEALALNAGTAAAYLALLQTICLGVLLLSAGVIGALATNRLDFVQEWLPAGSKASIALGVMFVAFVCFLLSYWSMTTQDVTSAASRLLAPASPTKEVAEALKAAKEIAPCEEYRQEAIQARGQLYGFDLEILLDLAEKERNSSVFYQKDLDALSSSAPISGASK